MGYMAIRPTLKTCVSVYLTFLSGISEKIFMADQVRPGYPKKTDHTVPCAFLPKKENSNNGNMLQIRNEKMKRLSGRMDQIRDVIG